MRVRKPKPLYTHDCVGCVYLGTVTFPAPYGETMVDGGRSEWVEQHAADLYCCMQWTKANPEETRLFGRTIIARSSSRGSDYASAPSTIVRDTYMSHDRLLSTFCPAIIAGYWFAVAKGCIEHVMGQVDDVYP